MSTRCAYCGKEVAEGETFCSEACAEHYNSALSGAVSQQKWLYLGLCLSLLVILFGPVSGTEQLTGIGVVLLGFVLVKWPFTLAEVVRQVGYAFARNICRTVGVTLMPLGFVTIFFM